MPEAGKWCNSQQRGRRLVVATKPEPMEALISAEGAALIVVAVLVGTEYLKKGTRIVDP